MRHEWIEKVSFLVNAGWQTRAPEADFIAFLVDRNGLLTMGHKASENQTRESLIKISSECKYDTIFGS